MIYFFIQYRKANGTLCEELWTGGFDNEIDAGLWLREHGEYWRRKGYKLVKRYYEYVRKVKYDLPGVHQ